MADVPGAGTGTKGEDGVAARGQRRGGERDALARLSLLVPPAPQGEVWYGDDAAVVRLAPGGPLLLLAADAVVGGVDADLTLTSLADLGWKAMTVNVSDIAAMGGRPLHAIVTVVGLGGAELEELYAGIIEASRRYACPVVGGDLSAGDQVVVSVAMTGTVEGEPVLRSGARPGDRIWSTGPLGAAAAGLRSLRARALPPQAVRSTGGLAAAHYDALVRAHARPEPSTTGGQAARALGATAMIDVSDGLVADLGHIADHSGIGFDLHDIPVAPGATLEDALGGGDDYVLAFTLPADIEPSPRFRESGLAGPYLVGTCLSDPSQRTLAGKPLVTGGWEHRL